MKRRKFIKYLLGGAATVTSTTVLADMVKPMPTVEPVKRPVKRPVYNPQPPVFRGSYADMPELKASKCIAGGFAYVVSESCSYACDGSNWFPICEVRTDD